MAILTVAIGMILVYLILSLVSSALQESVAGWLSLRGKYMWSALENMLEEIPNDKDNDEGEDKEKDDSGDKGKVKRKGEKWLLKEFQNHNYYMSLCEGKKKNRHPSYMKAATFSKIMLHILDGKTLDTAMSTVKEMSDGKVKASLMGSLEKTEGSVDKFRKELEEWYDEAMDRASGRYKRMTNNSLIIIGILVAAAFNGDSLSIYHKMTVAASSPEQTQQIIGLAEDLIDSRNDTAFTAQILRSQAARLNVTANEDPALTFKLDSVLAAQNLALKTQTEDLVATYAGANSPLGLGWNRADLPVWKGSEWKWIGFWLYKLVGLFITAMAISLGASFWFDLLKKITNIRNAGPTNETDAKANTAAGNNTEAGA